MNQITIRNSFISLTVLDYGAIIQKLTVKNKEGQDINVAVGFENPIAYLTDTKSLGAAIGRYAGRISKGGFELNDKSYSLFSNNGVHLHGGKEGFAKKYWNIEQVHHGDNPYITLSYFSKDMEEGYPGNLEVQLTYKLENNALHILHSATTDKATPVNLTNHTYFKLDDQDQIDEYSLQLACSQYLDTDEALVPSGKLNSVENTAYDFLTAKKIGKTRLDTPFVLNGGLDNKTWIASKKSGISMEVSTNQPSIVVYTPLEFAAICFETQNFPDAPNHPHFPNSILNPGETYENNSIFRFGFVN
ncbi:aldose 1-epimerase [Arenibacter nanhaiticus]|uniref:Aldose 1-epimerase n=1 Tax=Arenibacter nanhaiticus TaxID=558155 RepID=A0A1M6BCF6_9FLAO|nr:aldose epimerase family protein [Arenibacter nanhaiticus]SHI46367.1 aldose 1-epimerase [Arenibacter nanhaiticus]